MRSLLLAISFLTRIPVRTGEVSPSVMGASLAWFPFVGALVGVLPFCIASATRDHVPLIGFACVVTSVLITGALHLDGVADFADALGGGRGERSRMLEIMRDPRIGAHGATALVLVLSGKLIAVIELLSTRSIAWPLVIAPIVARFACVLAMRTFPYARKEGLGLLFHQNARWEQVAIAFIWLPLSVLALGALDPDNTSFPQQVAIASLAGLAMGLFVAWRAKRTLGGLTGDVHGAIIELSELAIVFAAAFA